MSQLFFRAVPIFFLLTSPAFAAENLNRWKSIFPDMPIISSAELEQRSKDVVLLDVRAKFEFDREHKAGARHISFSSRMFMLQMENLIEEHKGKTIVVYCDSKNCIKSYRAVDKCQKARLKNVVLFDLREELALAKQDEVYTQLNGNQF